MFEQYFAAGYHNISPSLHYKLNEIPKSLLKLIKKYDLRINNYLISEYRDKSDYFIPALNSKRISLTDDQIIDMLLGKDDYDHRYYNYFLEIIEQYNYKLLPFIKYIDDLITYEALNLNDILRELYDYCNMMSTISKKFDKYPRNFLTTHRIASRNYNRLRQEFNEQRFNEQIDTSMEWKYEDYVFIYPKSTQDIKDEAVQQNNCVASYVENVINGECHILFLRHKDEPEHSLVTIEVKNSEVVQAKQRFNNDISIDEQNVINKYNKYLKNRFKNIFNNQTKIEITNDREMILT